MNQEFYVGYQATAPPRLARFVKRVVVGLCAGGLILGVLLVIAQKPFAPARFEFGHFATLVGVIEAEPYLVLRSGDQRFLLVAPGKHGINAPEAYGKTVELKGALAQNGRDRILEVENGSIRIVGPAPYSNPHVAAAFVTLEGEIVDSKCHTGVMNPGRGKVHRDCAVRCISGGIPPALLVRDATDSLSTVLLSGENGEPLRTELLDLVAEPVSVTGTLTLRGQIPYLRIRSIRRN